MHVYMLVALFLSCFKEWPRIMELLVQYVKWMELHPNCSWQLSGFVKFLQCVSSHHCTSSTLDDVIN